MGLVAAGCWAGACANSGTVDAIAVDSVAISPETASILQGDTIRLVGETLDENGVAFLGPTFTWVSQNPSVALVAPDGLVTAGLPGATVVTAHVGSLSGSAQITVSARPFAVLSPNSLSFSAAAGGADPPDQSVTVGNAGGGNLSNATVGGVVYGAGQPAGWLTAGLSADFAMLTVHVTVGGLAAGTYDATVPVGIGGATGGAALTVTLVIS